MSYILDALKRSEQERHQGDFNQATIDTIMLPKKQVSHQWWPYILILILCINLGVFLYFQFRSSHSVAQQPTSTSSNVLNEQSKPSLTKSGQTLSDQGYASNIAEKPLPDHLMQKPVLQKRYDVSQLNASAKPQIDEKITFNSDGFEVIRPKGYDKDSLPVEMPELKEASTKSPVSLNVQRSADVVPENKNVDVVKVIPTNSVNEPNLDSIIHINDLDVSFQKQLPDIRFNSHIYSLSPADRRVMINDLYLREGQDFSGVRIETIGEFYIVLSKQAQRFKIPVLRDWYRPN